MASLLLRAGLRQAPRLAAANAAQRSAPVVAAAVTRLAPLQNFELKPVVQEVTTTRLASHFSHEQPHHTKEFIADRILLVLRLFDKIDPEKLTLESHFMNDLGLDSLDHVEIIHMLEEEFMFEFPDDDWERLFTPKDIQQYVCDRYDVFH